MMFKAKAAYGDDADSTLNRPVFIFLRFYVSGYSQFDPMALELDGDAHLTAWITAADVATAASHPAGRPRCPHPIDLHASAI